MVANVAGGVGGPRRYFVILPQDVPVAICFLIKMCQYGSIINSDGVGG